VSAHGGLDVSVAEVLTQERSRVPSARTWRQDVNRRIEIRCEGCGYGAVVSHLPPCCPMCGRATWVEAASVEPRSPL
jgi:hypothetical protein